MRPDRAFVTVILAMIFASSIFSPAVQAQSISVRISEPTDVTLSSTPGQQITPALISYEGTPYLFWSSNTWGDFDILYSIYKDGAWYGQNILTQDDSGYDHTPLPIVFGGDLFLLWSSDDANITGGGTDIVFSVFDGTTWTEPESLTIDFNDMGDYNPFPVVFNSKLYVFFEWYCTASGAYEIAYLVNDGNEWSAVTEITSGSTGHNLNPTAAVSDNSLVLAWESYSQAFIGTSADSAIVSRIYSAGSWSNYTSISGTAGPNNMDPFAIAYLGNIWVFWSSNSQTITDGDDMDIVARCYSQEWRETVYEISIGDSGDDTGVTALLFDDKLIVSWISGSPEYSPGTDTDIVLSEFDGADWSYPVDISQDDGGRNDAGGISCKMPALSVYNDELFIVWETNASPDITVHSDTWLMMVTYGPTAPGLGMMTWVILIAMIIIGIVGFSLFRRIRFQR